jgi:hypothetical protein
MKTPFSKQVETRVVAMTPVAFDPGAGVTSNEEATGGADDGAQDAPPDALPLTRLGLLISKLPLRVTRGQ